MTAAQKAEATNGKVDVEFAGHTYSFSMDDVTIDALELLENERYITALRAVFGDEQFELFKTRHKLASELNDFLQSALAAINARGNSSASPVS